MLREWLALRTTFLREIVEREAPPEPRCCSRCSGQMEWRCDDCFASPTFCTTCLVDSHVLHPFHRVAQWDGSTFYRSSLRKAGFVLYLCHGGAPCPLTFPVTTSSTTDDPSPDQREEISAQWTSPLEEDAHGSDHEESEVPQGVATDSARDTDDEELDFDTAGLSSGAVRVPKGSDGRGNLWMTLVDITGVHFLPIHFCTCPNAPLRYIQLLRHALYPVSYDRPQTAFSFRVLDDFDLDNLESKGTAQRYYAKLCRLTNNAFPHAVPDRYRELLRVIREWRNLTARKRAGFIGQRLEDDVRPGQLVPFCPTCPDPNVNLPVGWEKDKDQYAIACSTFFLLLILRKDGSSREPFSAMVTSSRST